MRTLWIVLIVMLAGVLLPLSAQDDEAPEASEEAPARTFDCAVNAVNLQMDTWYNEYIASRGEVDAEEALASARTFADNIAELTAFCTTEAEADGDEETIEQTGIGTIDAPFVIGAPGIVGDTTIDITRSILPANEFLEEQGITIVPATIEGREYFLVEVTVTCREGSTIGCRITPDSFRVIGDLGELYLPTLSEYDDYLPAPGTMLGGSERSGALPFLVDQADTSLRLVYFPNGDALETNTLAYYYDAQGTANSFEVTTTTRELIIRNAPVNGAPVGVLRSSQVATAIGRNVDSTWIRIEAPEGSGWVSADFIDTESDLESLSVIDE
ncbi:MAG: hypothetical protein ACFE0Q_08900 [Anaerolineae bacterium]